MRATAAHLLVVTAVVVAVLAGAAVPTSAAPGVPRTPTGLAAATVSATAVRFSWSSSGASRYDVVYAGTGLAADVLVRGVAGTSTTVTGLTPGGSYRFRVRSVVGGSVSGWSALGTVRVPLGIPAGLSLSVSGTAVRASWGAVTGAQSYDLLYAGGTAAGDTVVSGITTPSAEIGGLAAGASYRFRVRAVGVTRSEWSSLVRVTIPVPVPTPVSVSTPTSTGVTVRWGAVGPSATYEIAYAATATAGDVVVPVGTATTRRLDGLAAGGTYSIRVRAVVGAVQSPWSAPVTVVLPAATTGGGRSVDEVVGALNAERALRGLPALTWCARAARAAQSHSEDQAARGAISHTGTDGSTLRARLERSGYLPVPRAWGVAENVARGYSAAPALVTAWMGSSGHRANIVNPAYAHVGIGLVESGGPYWTAVFGYGGECRP